jgi:hypothetical protein
MISTTLVLSVLLGLVPLMGVAWTALNGTIATVDGLFMSLILFTLSGILFLNAYLEMRSKFLHKKTALPARKTS